MHWLSDVHTLPLATVPQLLFTQGLPTQSPSPAHVVAHALPLHLNGAQVTAAAGWHLPLPSQLEPVTVVLEFVSQLPPPQSVPL